MKTYEKTHKANTSSLTSKPTLTNPTDERLIARREACVILGNLCPHTLRRMEKRQLLTPYKVGGKNVSYRLSQVLQLIENGCAAANAQLSEDPIETTSRHIQTVGRNVNSEKLGIKLEQ